MTQLTVYESALNVVQSSGRWKVDVNERLFGFVGSGVRRNVRFPNALIESSFAKLTLLVLASHEARTSL